MNEVCVSVSGVDPPFPLDRVRRFCERALRKLGIEDREVSILLCNDEEMTDLNRTYRSRSGPTDVLSFEQTDPSIPGNRVLGDVVVSVDTARRNAERQHVSLSSEMEELIVHGLLHLMGMDHDGSKGTPRMLELQKTIMATLAEERTF